MSSYLYHLDPVMGIEIESFFKEFIISVLSKRGNTRFNDLRDILKEKLKEGIEEEIRKDPTKKNVLKPIFETCMVVLESKELHDDMINSTISDLINNGNISFDGIDLIFIKQNKQQLNDLLFTFILNNDEKRYMSIG